MNYGTLLVYINCYKCCVRYWRCFLRSKCPARMQTSVVTRTSDKPVILVQPSEHNHAPDLLLAVRGAGIAQMRKRVREAPLQPLHSAYQSTLASTSETQDLRVLLPDYKSVRTILQRERSCNIPKLPKTKSDINLDGEWSTTSDNVSFLLPHSNNDMLIFTTDANLRCLSECDTLYVDGTFKTCSSLSTQMYSIHGLYNGHIVPLAFSLLSDKTSANVLFHV